MIYEIKNYHNQQDCSFNLYDNCYICDIIRDGHIYEPFLHDVFEEYIDEGCVVIEGGCHIGLHSVKLSKLCKTLYCFEPLESSFNLLYSNLSLNKCLNTFISGNALSDKVETVNFNWVGHWNPGASGLENNPMGNISSTSTPETAQCSTIDGMNLEQLDFIKLDIEGYEPKALQGALRTIKKFKPIIVLECWSDHYGNASLEHTIFTFQNIIDLGYNVEQISHSDYLFLPL